MITPGWTDVPVPGRDDYPLLYKDAHTPKAARSAIMDFRWSRAAPRDPIAFGVELSLRALRAGPRGRRCPTF